MTAADLEQRETSGRGLGVFALRRFAAGEIVLAGVIEQVLEGNHKHASQVGEAKFVLHGGLAPLVNHSCDPNCGIHVNATGAHDHLAIRRIEAGQEILFDYAMRNYRIEHFPERCLCGATRCRGRITGWADLPAAWKQEYRPFAAPYLLAIDALYAGERSDLGGIEMESPRRAVIASDYR